MRLYRHLSVLDTFVPLSEPARSALLLCGSLVSLPSTGSCLHDAFLDRIPGLLVGSGAFVSVSLLLLLLVWCPSPTFSSLSYRRYVVDWPWPPSTPQYQRISLCDNELHRPVLSFMRRTIFSEVHDGIHFILLVSSCLTYRAHI